MISCAIIEKAINMIVIDAVTRRGGIIVIGMVTGIVVLRVAM